MRRIFGTVAGRLFLVLGLALLAGFNAYFAWTVRTLDPTVWYFWTTDGTAFHVRQTEGAIVARGFLPSRNAAPLGLDFREWEQRCGPLTRGKTKTTIDIAYWRGVALCNPGEFSGDEFDRRLASFKQAVDEEYARSHWEIADRHISATLWAIAVWLGALGAYGIGAWVIAPRRADR